MPRRRIQLQRRQDRQEMIATIKPRQYGMPARPSPGARLALQPCHVPGCSHWSAPEATHCRRCGGAL